MTGIDLNDTVTVTLTKRGAEILKFRESKRGKEALRDYYKKGYLAGKDYSMKLWELIDDFWPWCDGRESPPFTNLRKI